MIIIIIGATTITSETPATNVSYFMNFTCIGTEPDMNGCSNEKICSTCSSNRIQCYGMKSFGHKNLTMHIIIFIDDSSPCIEGSIRLADGSTNKNGRVEVCYNGVWGSICGSGWSLPDAIVVCNQLKLTNGSKRACNVM